MQELVNRAKELLSDGTVARVLGWKKLETCLTIRNRLTLKMQKNLQTLFTMDSVEQI